MKNDVIHVEITPEGLLKLDTDGISMPNHAAAEGLVRALTQLAGGETVKTRKSVSHTHGGQTHSHEEGHSH